MRGVPGAIRSDNGPEFVAQCIQGWLGRLQINALYVAPGSPWENGYAESFHSKLVDEFLSREQFESVGQARHLTTAWRDDYNHDRPHSSLGYVTVLSPRIASKATFALNAPSNNRRFRSIVLPFQGISPRCPVSHRFNLTFPSIPVVRKSGSTSGQRSCGIASDVDWSRLRSGTRKEILSMKTQSG